MLPSVGSDRGITVTGHRNGRDGEFFCSLLLFTNLGVCQRASIVSYPCIFRVFENGVLYSLCLGLPVHI